MNRVGVCRDRCLVLGPKTREEVMDTLRRNIVRGHLATQSYDACGTDDEFAVVVRAGVPPRSRSPGIAEGKEG